MEAEYRIDVVDKPEESVWKTIGGGLREFNTQNAGDDKYQSLCLVLNAKNNEIVGGLLADIYWDWLYINVLWVKSELRGKGFGRDLLLRAEEESRQRGAKSAYLDTFSFQAPDFYKKYGYVVFGELNDFPVGHTRIFLTKNL
ncbi:MAG: GNAT family N-acetyltransferase [Anaerolineaceae bacterium]